MCVAHAKGKHASPARTQCVRREKIANHCLECLILIDPQGSILIVGNTEPALSTRPQPIRLFDEATGVVTVGAVDDSRSRRRAAVGVGIAGPRSAAHSSTAHGSACTAPARSPSQRVLAAVTIGSTPRTSHCRPRASLMAATLPTNEGHDAGVSVPWRSRLDTSRLQAHDPTFRYVRRLTSSPLPRGGADFLAPGRGSSAPIFLT